nr:MAG TPA: chromosome partition protein [Bacteriophage sp.]
MRIILKSLHMENFKGIKSLEVNFSNKTSIKGQNAAGKTTIFDAFTWLLFNKNSAREEKFNIRPLDKDGNRIDNVEIKVVGVLDVEGKEVMLSKVQNQNWVKKRGTNTVTLQGNPNSYEIDGYPKSEADFNAYVSELAQSEDMFRLLTNPQYFSSLRWKEQRDILMKLTTEVSDVELAKEMFDENAYAESLIEELEKAPSTDDIRAKFSKALSEWKKKQAEIPVRIDEAEKSKVDVDTAEQELLKTDLERQIKEIELQMKSSSKVIDDLEQQKFELQFEVNDCKRKANESLIKERRSLDDRKDEATIKFNDLHKQITKLESEIVEKKKRIHALESEKAELGKQYMSEKEKAFDETPYLFDEFKWKFDESTTVCSLCGQRLPEDKIEQLKTDFEEKKAKAKEDAAERLKTIRESFNNQKVAELNRIASLGTDKKSEIEIMKSDIEDAEKKLPELREQETEQMKIKNECIKKLSELPEEADLSTNDDYKVLMKKDTDLQSQIDSARANSIDTSELGSKKLELEAALEDAKTIIAQAAKNVEIDERIAQLQAEQKEIGQKVADQEQMLYLLEEFIRFKLNKVSESINSHFKTVNFKLFEMQLNGGLKDCCECTVNGVPYSTLNSGHRIVAGLDIIRSLSEMYGVSCPIFVDNAESLNEFNVPDMDAQLILLSVSEDKQLKVEEM